MEQGETSKADASIPLDDVALREHLASIVASSDDAIVSKTLEGIIVSWNRGAERMFGYTAAEVVGCSVTILMPPEQAQEEPDILARLRRGERIDHYETVRRRKDGTLLDVSLCVSPIRNASGQVIGASKIARDITLQKRGESEREALLRSERAARAEAERLGRLKDEFLATLSHELRSPLNAIAGWASLLKRVPPGSPDLQRGLATIERNTRLQAQIISDLLDMSRIISGRLLIELQPTDLHDVICAALDAIRPAAEAKQLSVQQDLEPTIQPVRGDPARLQQVMWNLLSNAVKFTSRGGRIEVGLRRTDSQVQISVTDDGIGIDPRFLPWVFDRFRQADASITRNHGGLGIGLSIAKHLVELHGGAIRVDSPGPGRGATFTVELPISSLREEAAGGSIELQGAAAADLPSLAGVTALVVEDEPDSRALAERLIGQQGARVLAASNSREALELIGRERIDVLVSDIGMPGMDGYQLMRQVRASPAAWSRVPAIALTAYASADDRERARRAGYQLHLPKPVGPHELVAGIASLLKRVGPTPAQSGSGAHGELTPPQAPV